MYTLFSIVLIAGMLFVVYKNKDTLFNKGGGGEEDADEE